jgi:hypothetical protein
MGERAHALARDDLDASAGDLSPTIDRGPHHSLILSTPVE